MVVRAAVSGVTGLQNEPTAWVIQNSLKFNGTSTQLNRTPSSAGTTTTWTLSYWIKLGNLSSEAAIYSAVWSGTGYTATWYSAGATNRVKINQYLHPTNIYSKCPTPLYRDTASWMHVVVVYDSTNATADDRVRFYVNGARLIEFADDGSSVGGTTNPSQNQASAVNNNVLQYIGCQYDGTYAFADSFLAEMHMIDGTAVTNADDFGFTHPQTGAWVPKKYEGTWGTNGWYLDFSDPTDLGADRSGNGNDWNPVAFTSDSVSPDSPSGVAYGSRSKAGISTSLLRVPPANYAIFNQNSAIGGGKPQVREAGTRINAVSAGDGCCDATVLIPETGKFYVEGRLINITGGLNQMRMGLQPLSANAYKRPGDDGGSYGFRWNDSAGTQGGFNSGTFNDRAADGLKFAADQDIVGIQIDMSQGTIKTHLNGVYFNSGGNVITGIAASEYFFRTSVDGGGAKQTGVRVTWGQQDYLFPPGTSAGANGRCGVVTYTGDGLSSKAITGLGFKPDLVLVKDRLASTDWIWTDSVRGATKDINSNDTSAQATSSSNLQSFDSDGFTIGNGSQINLSSGRNYAAWGWQAGAGNTSTNSTGSIDAAVSVATTTGFSIMQYEGNVTSGATIGHGLGSTPKFIIVKNFSSGTQNWTIYHSYLGATKSLAFTTGQPSTDTAFWNDTEPSDTVITLGNDNRTNASGDQHIAYAWSEIPGYSKFGTFVGNGDNNGHVLSGLGFRPQIVMFKSVDSNCEWSVYDRTRQDERANPGQFRADASDAELKTDLVKVILTEDGFHACSSDAGINKAGDTYIYAAWGDPFTVDETFRDLTANENRISSSGAAANPDNYVGIVTYTGSGSARDINPGFEPGLVWIKNRDVTDHHALFDTIRGPLQYISSNRTNGSAELANTLTSFKDNGFTLGSANLINFSGQDYVAWCWRAGGSSNTFNIDGTGYATAAAAGLTGGTITPTGASVNTTAGFSVLQYTGTGAVATLAHGLNDDVKFILIKRTNVDGNSWAVYHDALGADKQILLNSTNNVSDDANGFNDVPSSGLIRFGDGSQMDTNQVGAHICYAWSEVPGYSKFGYYVGGTNPNQVITGFRPAVVLIKVLESGNWVLFDDERNKYNVNNQQLAPNSNGAEVTNDGDMDFVSNGFVLRGGAATTNAYTYIYAAWAKSPFGSLNGVQPTAR
jgi:hypothetical protein